MSETILRACGLTREFKRRGTMFAAVDHVDLTVSAGELVAIVGRSGNGKSTLLNLITGLLTPTSGSAVVDGRDVSALGDREISRLRNTTIGFVPQSHTLLGNLTVLDNVMLSAVLGGKNEGSTVIPSEVEESHDVEPDPDMPDVIAPMPVAADAATEQGVADTADPLTSRAMGLLDRLGVADLASCYPKELSGGEMRRVSIARALMNHPKLLIADEPTGDLDADSTAIVMHLLRETADDGTAVLMVTHDPDALVYVDSRYRMDRGVLTQE